MKSDNFMLYSIRTIVFIVIFPMFPPIHPSVFFRCFLSDSRACTELRIEPFIEPTMVDSYNSVNHNCEQVLN